MPECVELLDMYIAIIAALFSHLCLTKNQIDERSTGLKKTFIVDLTLFDHN